MTPSKASRMQPEESRKISLEFAVTGLKTISRLPRDSAKQPFRFMYISGSNAERDQNKKPWILGDYSLMRVSKLSFFFFPPSLFSCRNRRC